MDFRDHDMPIFTLIPALRPEEEQLGGTETADDRLTAVRVTYGASAEVETTRAEPGPLRETLEHHVRLGGDRFADLPWTESAATLRIDGRLVAARMLRAGERWWAVRGDRDGIAITVVGRDWHPAEIAVETMTDPQPMLQRRRPSPHRRPPAPAAGDTGREPHQALADVVLSNAAAHARWLAEGGPQPALPGSWSSLWRAAVRRQVELSGRSESVADRAVSEAMAQLGTLHHEAAWFREDDDLRRRAVAEVLLYATELSDRVPSRPAQEAWRRRSERDTGPRLRTSAEREWAAAWQEWADARRRT